MFFFLCPHTLSCFGTGTYALKTNASLNVQSSLSSHYTKHASPCFEYILSPFEMSLLPSQLQSINQFHSPLTYYFLDGQRVKIKIYSLIPPPTHPLFK